jgi:hypothetical protein
LGQEEHRERCFLFPLLAVAFQRPSTQKGGCNNCLSSSRTEGKYYQLASTPLGTLIAWPVSSKGLGYLLPSPLIYTLVQWYKIQAALSDPTHQEGGVSEHRGTAQAGHPNVWWIFVIAVTVLGIYHTTSFPTVSYVCIRGTITWKSIHKLSPESLLHARLRVMGQACPWNQRAHVNQERQKCHQMEIPQGTQRWDGECKGTAGENIKWQIRAQTQRISSFLTSGHYVSSTVPVRICHDTRLSECLRKEEIGSQLWHLRSEFFSTWFLSCCVNMSQSCPFCPFFHSPWNGIHLRTKKVRIWAVDHTWFLSWLSTCGCMTCDR